MIWMPAVFLDRDGVIIEDVDILNDIAKIRIMGGVPSALQRLKSAGYKLIVTTNQPVVARGLLSEEELQTLHNGIQRVLLAAGSPAIDEWYYCPHHPNATLPAYRMDCECRKPKPGMLLCAAKEHAIDLAHSFMVGDRITDILAGSRVGCRTVLVQTGKHLAPPIQTSEVLDLTIQPNYTCTDLFAAANWILENP